MTSRTKLIVGIAVFAVMATGLALLYHERQLVAACRTVPRADEAQFREAEDMFRQGNMAFSRRNYSTASDLFDMAASKLGDIYQMTGGGKDDTGTALEAGRAAAKQSEFQLAAQIKKDAMAARISSFLRKQHLSERCHAVLARIGL
jgi:hypothetical protein